MSPRSRIYALAICLFALVVGCRWGVCGRYGTDIPETDEWDAEGINLFVARAHHDLGFANFWATHVDHHVLLTRALAYVEMTGNGWWDQRLETVVNACLAGIIAVGLWLWMAPRLDRRWAAIWFILLAILYAPPWATDNVLRGFHSQQLFLVGLALITLAAPLVWEGWLAAVLALGSMASGFFAAALAAAMVLWRRRSLFPSILIYAGVVIAAFAVQKSMPATDALKARAAWEFGASLLQSVGWPAYAGHWGYGALLLYLPWAWLLLRTLRRERSNSDAAQDFIVLIGAWGLAQSIAAAYARGWHGLPPPTRYLDNVIIGLLANALSLWALRANDAIYRALAAVWFVLLFTGLAAVWPDVVSNLRETQRSHGAMTQNVRGYLTTGDKHFLERGDIPYPTIDGTQFRLDLAELRPLLPPSIHIPSAAPAPAGSRWAWRLTRGGFFLGAAGAVAALVVLLL